MSVTNASSNVPAVPIPITLEYVFGLKGDVKNNIHYLDDTTVIYPAGFNIVIYNMDKKTQRFIALGSSDRVSSCDISAMCLLNSTHLPSYSHAEGAYSSSNNNTNNNSNANNNTNNTNKTTKLLAVAERGESGTACITVIDLHSLRKRTRYTLSSPDVNSTEYVCLAFSSDGKYLLTQGGGPDWTLVHWSWEKGKVLHTVRVSNTAGGQITHVSYCPVDPNVICVTGNGILRFLHCEEKEMRAINVSMDGFTGTQHYTCHCWIEERVLVATDTGDVLLFENAEFLGALSCSPGDGKTIEVLCPYSKGFLAGCDEGVIYVYTCDEKNFYSLSQSFQIENNLVKITNIAVSPSEEHVVVTLENDQSFTLTLNLSNQHNTHAAKTSSVLAVDELNIVPLTPPCHFQAILGLAVCNRKPLVASCGLDRSVRLWNYLTRQLVLLQFFSEQPLSVALHPTGLQMLVGFADGIRVFSILVDTFKCVYQYPVKACREIQISNGGQYFAVANGSVVQIYAFYSFDQIGSFTLHRGRVKSIFWSTDDSILTTTSVDGYTYSFRVSNFNNSVLVNGANTSDFHLICSYKVSRGHTLAAITDTDSKGTIYVSTSDMRVRVQKENECVAQQQHAVTINSLAIVNNVPLLENNTNNNTSNNTNNINATTKVLFGGSDAGILRCFVLPLSNVCFDIQCHSAAITRVLVTPCCNYIITAGEDGLISIFNINNTNGTNSVLNGMNMLSLGGNNTTGTTSTNTNSTSSNGSSLVINPNSTLNWSDEVLVGYDELTEQENKIMELQQRVDRTIIDNETILQQKKAYFIERRADLERKFQLELDDTINKQKELDEQRRKSESWFAYRVEQLSQHHEEKQKAQEILYTDKVHAEEERCRELTEQIENEYREMQAEEEAFLFECEAAKNLCIEQYQRDTEQKMAERQQLIAESQKKATEYSVLKQAIEDDVDEEIAALKNSFEGRFLKERTTTLKLRDSNTVQQQKFNELRTIVQKELSDQTSLKQKQEELFGEVNEANQQIQIYVRELHERDATMKDKIDRLTQLKKQSQEQEKFKFVLDSKLFELQRQLAPRREEMHMLRSQVTQMQKELQQYQHVGDEQDLNVSSSRAKYTGLEGEIKLVTDQRIMLQNRMNAFKVSIQEVLGNAIQSIYRIQHELKSSNNTSNTNTNNTSNNNNTNNNTNNPNNTETVDEIEAALSAIAKSSIHQLELSTVTKQMKHGLRQIYQQHVLNIDENKLLEAQKSLLAYQRIHDNAAALRKVADTQNEEKKSNGSNTGPNKKHNVSSKVAFGTNIGGKLVSITASVSEERTDYERERGYLERCIDNLVNKSDKDQQMRSRETNRIIRENVILIEEINELRREQQITKLVEKKKSANNSGKPELGVREQLEGTLQSQQEQVRALKNYIMVLEAQEAEYHK